ncbi:MAG: three-Cys-motif partner protein TcmP [Candidatus Tectomicrobia bacterium]|nr:three-Cys-motif partner protein TcmP [Candidatus Tectomicrobia bacterium]
MRDSSFFDESKEQSQVKSEIVAKYFWAWAKVIIPSAQKRDNKIAYIDLFAGPGRYKDGAKSTPLLVLERAIQEKDVREMLITIFNDTNLNNTQSLQDAINSMANIANLKHKPQVYNKEVGEEIVKMFEQMHLVPTLFFVDPWGYKGLSLRLINSVLKDWGCDCILFFNYNRINMGLHNEAVEEHMNALFSKERADKLREQLEPMPPLERELAIVETIGQALKEMGGKYVLPFRFKNARGNRTSHHLVFVTKNVKGYEIMKEIMAKESSNVQQGVPSFEYNPATSNQLLLFELSRPLDDLVGMLLNEFACRKMTMLEVYNNHHVGKRYIKANYKDVLVKLESERKITTDPPADRRPKRKGEVTFADTVRITFPPKGGK